MSALGDDAELLQALGALGPAILELVDRKLERAGLTGAAPVDLVREGERRGVFESADAGNIACRSGKVRGASKVGRKWLGPLAALESYVREHGRPPAPRPKLAAVGPANDAAPADPLLEATRAAARRARGGSQ